MVTALDLSEFCVQLPKIELHAHINGSISPKTMHRLREIKKHKYPELADFTIPERLDRISDFFPLFKFIYKLTDDEEAVGIATRNVIDEFAQDGVRYLELRTTPRRNPDTGMTKESYLKAVLSAVNEPRDNIIVRLIVSIDRRNTLEEAYEAVDLAMEFRSQNVVGIDLCGDVHQGSFEQLRPAFDKARTEGFHVTLHFNEVKENMVEAPNLLSFGPDRLGHATLLDDYARQTIYANSIPIEICMTSNVVSKTVETFADHHVKDLLKEGHPFVLCTDDKGVFFSDLSNEYAVCSTTFNMTRDQLFEASLRSIDAIFAGPELQSQLKQQWCEWREANATAFA
ncbi:hypothetical protein BDB00DRAFT_857936 [Zychaea mexicana]|uniref:uncharacterized protein n=1 Tax=Zychaea mexicana TaxID=64656 RepID=UPI0022FEC9B4|nr:uncharacterized protein BDB00DRAFT_857936 [Zychaea mexicana]KAI9480241.1 hypothetical protein BDB00DRAFT_857936 [Zychaea mexicana]